jgi:crotonobetainyl-CoA:carnitine CoA-transferase CaiB-like acyl-CoA transferase
MVAVLEDSSGRAVPTVAAPIALSSTPPTYRRPPPRLGEHTDEVLAELGMRADPNAPREANRPPA